MKNKFILILVFFSQLCLSAQDFGIKFSGFVKNDFFYDSRQTVNIREGHFLLFPAAKNPDAQNNDLNAKSAFNFLSIQTRLTGNITAPDALGAKVSGVIEADFFGNENASFVDVNGFRLRHAFAKLSWQNTELLFGQYWHPFLLPAVYSEVLSFNTGSPFQPFSRNPQIRVVHKLGNVSLTGVLSAQRDFTSPGGSVVLRNAAMPEINGQIQYEAKNAEAKTGLLLGAGAGFKSLQPLLSTQKGTARYKTEEKVSGISATGFLKITLPSLTYKIQGVYGQNAFDLLMLGGYAVKGITDTSKNTVEYTTVNNLAVWTEIITGTEIQAALWAGYSKNLGSSDNIAVYSNQVGGTDATVRGVDMEYLFRVSPRVVFVSGKYSIGLETEYTTAAYATRDNAGKLNRDINGKITDSETISNLRVLLSVILKF